MRAIWTPATRFWRKVDRTGNCWLWKASVRPDGYGQFGLFPGVVLTVHRMAWVLGGHGPIPPGMFVLHRCDVKTCVRPSHLFLGTQWDNMQDMRRKARGTMGETHPNSTLTDDAVRAIRETAAPTALLAQQHGVCQRYVQRIRRGERRACA